VKVEIAKERKKERKKFFFNKSIRRGGSKEEGKDLPRQLVLGSSVFF